MPTSKTELLLHRVSRVCALAMAVSRFANMRSLDSNWLMTVVSWFQVVFALHRKRFIEAGLGLALLLKFRVPFGRPDADRISLLQHIFRVFVHGRSDYHLGELCE
jgi:hypothetical protein